MAAGVVAAFPTRFHAMIMFISDVYMVITSHSEMLQPFANSCE